MHGSVTILSVQSASAYLISSLCVQVWKPSGRTLHHMQQRISAERLQSRASRADRALVRGGNAASARRTAAAGSGASVRGCRSILLPLLALQWWSQVHTEPAQGPRTQDAARWSGLQQGRSNMSQPCPSCCKSICDHHLAAGQIFISRQAFR